MHIFIKQDDNRKKSYTYAYVYILTVKGDLKNNLIIERFFFKFIFISPPPKKELWFPFTTLKIIIYGVSDLSLWQEKEHQQLFRAQFI